MPVIELTELRGALAQGKRVLALDLGEKTIGVAISDATLTVATPIEIIRRTKFTADAERLAVLVREREAGAFLLGLPINMDGTEGKRCQSVRAFAANLLARLDLPLVFWDERLSTAAVERMLIDEADMSRQRRREVVDKAAAAYILQGALDRLRASRPSP
jgi:putative Holliday junction resolvase